MRVMCVASSDRYQDWLRDQEKKGQQTAMVSELDSRLAARPTKSPADFYRPMSEKMIDSKVEHQPAYRPPVPDPVSTKLPPKTEYPNL